MARMARLVVAGLPHHVIQRGVRSMDIFADDADREAYLGYLAAAGEHYGLEFLAWCLMSSHVHLLVVPREARALGLGIGDAHRRYTRQVNFRQGVRGHLFQARFRSSVIQKDDHLVAVGRYVELNPVQAGLVERAEDWPWSSAAFNAGRRAQDRLVRRPLLRELAGPWRRVLRDGEEEAARKRLAAQLDSGLPVGSERWIGGLESTHKRRLRPGQPGRPRKDSAAEPKNR
jgi:putative transposase